MSILEDRFIRPVEDCAPYVWENADPTEYFIDLYNTIREQFERGMARKGIKLDHSEPVENENIPGEQISHEQSPIEETSSLMRPTSSNL